MCYNPATCLADLTQEGLLPTCDSSDTNGSHCQDFMESPVYHQDCFNQNLYAPVQQVCCINSSTNAIQCFASNTIQQCLALNQQDSAWNFGNCYCCCSCFARDTLVGTPAGDVEIFTLGVGADVLMGSATGGTVTWKTGKVSFSAGTGPQGHQPLMVYIVYGDENAPKDVVCSADQPFLTPDGNYILGRSLQPHDQLVDIDGNAVTVLIAAIGEYNGGVHHISTDAPWVPSGAGHLIQAGGLVAGDFDLQVNFPDMNSISVVDGGTRPVIGTAEYEAALPPDVTRSTSRFVFGAARGEVSGQKVLKHGTFTAYRRNVAPMYGAQQFFTPQQAVDILVNGSQIPISSPLPQTIFNQIVGQFAGFYPDVQFVYSPLDIMPNLYALELFGLKVVIVSGGLARTVGLGYEGLLTAMGWGVGCFDAGKPLDSAGYSAVALCDYWSFGIVSRRLWFGSPWITYAEAAMTAWQKLFDLIDPANRGGNPKDPLGDPSIDCRVQALQAGFAGDGLPACITGQSLPDVVLEQASAPSLTTVDLVFSIELTGQSLKPANFKLTPDANITGVAFGAPKFKVTLTTELTPATPYTIAVSGVTSTLGTPIDPAQASATFTSPQS